MPFFCCQDNNKDDITSAEYQLSSELQKAFHNNALQ